MAFYKRFLGRLTVAASLLVGVSALAPLTATSEPDELPRAAQVLERYIDALGGREALNALKTRHCTGRLVTDLAWKDPRREVTPFVVEAATPDLVRTLEPAGDAPRTSKLQMRDKLAWILNPHGPLRTDNYFPDLFVAGTEVRDGRLVYRLESSEQKPTYWALYFDVEDGLLRHIGYYWSIEDYREIDGVLFPLRIVTSRKGGSSTYEFDSVQHNQPVTGGGSLPESIHEALDGEYEFYLEDHGTPLLIRRQRQRLHVSRAGSQPAELVLWDAFHLIFRVEEDGTAFAVTFPGAATGVPAICVLRSEDETLIAHRTRYEATPFLYTDLERRRPSGCEPARSPQYCCPTASQMNFTSEPPSLHSPANSSTKPALVICF